MRVVGCFLEYDDKFAILYRRSHKPDGNTWGLPGGKVEANETDAAAIIRELEEETGYQSRPVELQHLGDYAFTSTSGIAAMYITYRLTLKSPHDIQLESSAHSEYRWVTAEECYQMTDLIHGMREVLDLAGH